jgi:hypothetical protein
MMTIDATTSHPSPLTPQPAWIGNEFTEISLHFFHTDFISRLKLRVILTTIFLAANGGRLYPTFTISP